jgi:CheY-like chemotaxis protein
MLNAPSTLLIVDDEPSIRESLSHVLTEIGYRVRSAEDGFTALREMRHEVPDLLLSDLNMPNMSGFELLSVVRRRFPAIRTIAMSGSFSGDEVPSGVAADGFYQKGSSIVALLRIITSLPRIERHAIQPSNPETPLWIHRTGNDTSPDEHVIITCPECLRSFSQPLGAGYLPRKTDCIYCESPIHYAIAEPADQITLQGFQREPAAVMPFSLNVPNLNY